MFEYTCFLIRLNRDRINARQVRTQIITEGESMARIGNVIKRIGGCPCLIGQPPIALKNAIYIHLSSSFLLPPAVYQKSGLYLPADDLGIQCDRCFGNAGHPHTKMRPLRIDRASAVDHPLQRQFRRQAVFRNLQEHIIPV